MHERNSRNTLEESLYVAAAFASCSLSFSVSEDGGRGMRAANNAAAAAKTSCQRTAPPLKCGGAPPNASAAVKGVKHRVGKDGRKLLSCLRRRH